MKHNSSNDCGFPYDWSFGNPNPDNHHGHEENRQ